MRPVLRGRRIPHHLSSSGPASSRLLVSCRVLHAVHKPAVIERFLRSVDLYLPATRTSRDVSRLGRDLLTEFTGGVSDEEDRNLVSISLKWFHRSIALVLARILRRIDP